MNFGTKDKLRTTASFCVSGGDEIYPNLSDTISVISSGRNSVGLLIFILYFSFSFISGSGQTVVQFPNCTKPQKMDSIL